MKPTIHTIILAAGQGKRMKSSTPKVLHTVGGMSLVEHVIQIGQKLKAKSNVVVLSKGSDSIQKNLLESANTQSKTLKFATQTVQNGTGGAVKAALPQIKDANATVLVFYGDTPLLRAQTVKTLLQKHTKTKAVVSFMTGFLDDATGFGRVIRDKGQVVGVVEHKDATAAQKQINEVNLGGFAFDLAFLKKNISKLKNNNKQGEFYLPDLIDLAAKQGHKVGSHTVKDLTEAYGVNNQLDLHKVNQVFHKRRREDLMLNGVAMVGDQIFIDHNVKVAAEVRLESPCYLKGNTTIETGVVVEQGCTIHDSKIQKGTHIKAHSYLTECQVGVECQIGPFAHLRPKAVMKTKSKVGNFVEMKKTTLGEGSKANHLTYLGDATIGKKVNVGAGTITCNYDGYNKFKTILEDGVFIGSNSELVAPVKIKKGAIVGAGTTVTQGVSQDSLVISRVYQKEIKGWAKEFRSKKS